MATSASAARTAEDGYASREDVKRQAAGWTGEVLECRVDGHTWRPSRASYHATHHYFYIVQRCARCQSERHRELNAFGHVVASWYVYADGYLTKDVGRIVGEARDELRLSALERLYHVTRVTRLAESPHSAATRRAIGMVG